MAIAVTGIAGPGGGSADKPVGLVWFGWRSAARPAATARQVFPGERGEVRHATVAHALSMLLRAAGADQTSRGQTRAGSAGERPQSSG